MLSFLNNPYSAWFWIVWALLLIWQNYAFTYVSRARNSGSLMRHAKASLQSNGVWFLQSLMAVSAFTGIITGKYGIKLAVVSVFYYTAFTMSGSLYAHYRALQKEKGKDAVGANKRYAQIPVEEWAALQERLAALESTNVPPQQALQAFGDHFGIPAPATTR